MCPFFICERRLTRKEQELEALLIPTVRGLGCEVWGVEFRARGRHSTLRLFIDRDDGVSIEDCERVSHQVSALLDVEDPIIEKYRLEVSSPGLDRILFRPEQYRASIGEMVDVRLTFGFEGRRHFVGRLVDVVDDELVVHVYQEEYVLPIEQVQRTRVVPDFDEKGSNL